MSLQLSQESAAEQQKVTAEFPVGPLSVSQDFSGDH
jgi:hypothetical protein